MIEGNHRFISTNYLSSVRVDHLCNSLLVPLGLYLLVGFTTRKAGIIIISLFL